LFGQELVVQYLARVGAVHVIVASHPDGGLITLPEAELRASATRPDALFDAESVRTLLSRLETLVQR